jgi:hypothetical protein
VIPWEAANESLRPPCHACKYQCARTWLYLAFKSFETQNVFSFACVIVWTLLSYTRHTARFLEVWLLFVPFGLFDYFGNSWNHWAM